MRRIRGWLVISSKWGSGRSFHMTQSNHGSCVFRRVICSIRSIRPASQMPPMWLAIVPIMFPWWHHSNPYIPLLFLICRSSLQTYASLHLCTKFYQDDMKMALQSAQTRHSLQWRALSVTTESETASVKVFVYKMWVTCNASKWVSSCLMLRIICIAFICSMLPKNHLPSYLATDEHSTLRIGNSGQLSGHARHYIRRPLQ